MRFILVVLLVLALIILATEAQQRNRRQQRVVRNRALTRSRTKTSSANNRRLRTLNGKVNTRLSRRRSTRLYGSSSSSSNTPSSRCVIYTRNCNVTANVCGRWSLTRRCHRFRNRCQLERANCRTSVSSWNVVNFGNCSSISVNETGTCASTFSSSSTTSSTSTSSSNSSTPWANVLSSILGTTYPSSSTSNVRPIIIRTG